MLRLFLTLVCIAVIGTSTTACTTNPATGKSGLVLVSSKKEQRIGAKLHDEIMQDEVLYADEEWHLYVNLVGQQIAQNSDWPEQKFEFFVLESDDVNAFALPNAHVFITTGMLMHLNKESHLAAVLAHEIAHVTARHTARKLTRNTLMSLVSEPVGLAAWFIPGVGLAVGDQIDAKLAKTQSVLVKGYGRELELQADTLGARYLAASGYQPEDMLEVLGILKDHEEYRRDQVEQLATRELDLGVSYHASDTDTHPSADQRLQEVIRAAESYVGSGKAREDRENYMLMVDGLSVINHQKYAMDADWAEFVQVSNSVNAYMPYTFEQLDTTALAKDHVLRLPVDYELASYVALDSSHKVARNEQNEWESRYLNNVLIFHVEAIPDDRNPKEFLLEFINQRAQALDYRDHQKVTSRFGEGYFIHANAQRDFTEPVSDRDRAKPALAEHLYGVMYIGDQAIVVETYGGVFDFDTVMYPPLFKSILSNLRPQGADDRFEQAVGQQQYQVALQDIEPGDTFASLASNLLMDRAEEKLRLINGMYPSGEPEVGQRLKVFSSSPE